MPAQNPVRRHRGFTLVELLIVVIILAILAAIVIPQFSSATKDTQESAIDVNLAGMRNAIELYKVQHNVLPGAAATTGGTCTGGTAGTGAVNTATAFSESLTMYSDKSGKTCSVQVGEFKFGPYIRKALPKDPISDSNTVAVSIDNAPISVTAATGGWAYNATTGQIVMNSNALDSKQVAYSQR